MMHMMLLIKDAGRLLSFRIDTECDDAKMMITVTMMAADGARTRGESRMVAELNHVQ